jgi:outer membrane protein TolC
MLHLQHIYANIVIVKNQVLGEEFNMKKILSLAIIASLAMSYALPAVAIENVNITEKVAVKKVAPTINKYEYVNMPWWQAFNDEHLNGHIVKALENNKDLKMATLTIDEYYQNVISQRSAQLPTINAGFLPGLSDIGQGSSDSYAFPIFASWELDIYGKNSNKTNSVRKLWESSILDERAAYISIASAVGSTYINIVKMDAMIDLQEDIVKLRKEIFEMMEISNAEGFASTFDLVKANKAYILGVTELTDLKKNRTKMLHQLAVLTGDSPNNIEEYARASYKTLAYTGIIP